MASAEAQTMTFGNLVPSSLLRPICALQSPSFSNDKNQFFVLEFRIEFWFIATCICDI